MNALYCSRSLWSVSTIVRGNVLFSRHLVSTLAGQWLFSWWLSSVRHVNDRHAAHHLTIFINFSDLLHNLVSTILVSNMIDAIGTSCLLIFDIGGSASRCLGSGYLTPSTFSLQAGSWGVLSPVAVGLQDKEFRLEISIDILDLVGFYGVGTTVEILWIIVLVDASLLRAIRERKNRC